ncbi:hypothetical protein [Pontiella sulfatireligans]|uniref:hypothetical protein n=1 Tax=Pontiella sulfatireligans TaxID=2750658 RepID=UPI00109C0F32|nr:hypothetical protein [Pontiella sulfatireligans]
MIARKWHLAAEEIPHLRGMKGTENFSPPEEHGFDVNVLAGGNGMPGSCFYPWDTFKHWNLIHNLDSIKAPEGTYLTDVLTETALLRLSGAVFFRTCSTSVLFSGISTMRRANPQAVKTIIIQI